MLKRKRIREQGKLKFSRFFKNLKEGDRVAIVREISFKGSFPNRIQGRIGVVESKRGDSYIINMKIGKEKRYIVHPVHLKKVK